MSKNEYAVRLGHEAFMKADVWAWPHAGGCSRIWRFQ